MINSLHYFCIIPSQSLYEAKCCNLCIADEDAYIGSGSVDEVQEEPFGELMV